MMLLTCLFVGIGLVTAQTSKVTGLVVSEEDGQPVIGASVAVKGATVGAVSDIDGKFSISNVPSSAKTLVISYIGMVTQEVAIKPNLKITLKSNAQVTDEVVVVAYGTAKKSSFTGSASTIKADKISKQQNSNVSKALEGAVAGVQITSSTGQPGSSATISVRGIGSISASRSPLIVVDGVPYEGSLNSINNADIESMTILKDAAANSLYGARGANGVVMITTKKGANGKTKISLEAKWGSNSRGVKAYKTIRNEGDYYEMFWEAMKNTAINVNGLNPIDAGVFASKNLVGQLGGYNSYNVADSELIDPISGKLNQNASLLYHDNWQKDPFVNGLRQEYNLSMSGGTDKNSFYVSMNYLDDNSYLRNSNFKRYSGRLKLDHQATEWLKTGFNMSYAQTDTNSPEVGGSNYSSLFYFGQNIAPIYPIYRYDANGSVLRDATGQKAYDYGVTEGHTRSYGSNANPYSQLINDIRNTTYDVMSAKAYVEAKFLKDFKFTLNLSADNFNYVKVGFQTPIGGDALNVNGRSSRTSQRYFALNTNQLLTYDKKINDHHFDVLVGHEIKADKSTYLYAQKEQFLIPNNPELANGAALKDATSYTTEYRLEGFFGRAQYDYKDKYYLTGSYRRDASSRFHPDNRWGSFWSVGASWRLKQESFLSEVEPINDLKLKVSYGTQGNDDIGNNTPYLDQYDVVPQDGSIGLVYSWRGNKDLTWEKSKNFNTGLEFGFWERFTGDIEYFIKSTSDLLYYKPMPPSAGLPNKMPVNDMAMKNYGIEANLGVKIINTNNIKWSIDGNITKYKNEVTRLAKGKDPKGYYTGDYWRKEGGSLYDWYTYKYAGVDPNNGDALYYMDVKDDAGVVTDVKTTNDPNKATRYEIGKSAIPTLYGGLATTVEAYGFDFSIATAFQGGGYIMDSGYMALMDGGSAGTNWSPDIFARWTPQNQNTNVPRVQQGYQYANQSSDRFLVKNDCFSLKNITLGYTLPKRILSRIGVQSLRVYAVGDNLYFTSKRQGLDPRQYMDGSMNAAAYSAIRTISFGLNLNF